MPSWIVPPYHASRRYDRFSAEYLNRNQDRSPKIPLAVVAVGRVFQVLVRLFEFSLSQSAFRMFIPMVD